MSAISALETVGQLGIVLMIIGPFVAAAGEMLASDMKRAKTRYQVIQKYV